MQGLPAYFYDVVRPNTTVELNGCRYNHMGADVYYDDVPNFIKKYKDLHGKCRRNVEGCEDCRKTDMDLVKNVHFTNCRKPWNCAGRSSTGKGDIDPRTADYDHCMQVRRLSSRPDPGRLATKGGMVDKGAPFLRYVTFHTFHTLSVNEPFISPLISTCIFCFSSSKPRWHVYGTRCDMIWSRAYSILRMGMPKFSMDRPGIIRRTYSWDIVAKTARTDICPSRHRRR